MIVAAQIEDILQFEVNTGYRSTSNFKGIKLVKNEEIHAIAGYDFWTPNAVQMHIWIPKPEAYLDREFIQEAFVYPFVTGNRGLVIGVTPGDNKRALEFNRKVGFKEVHRIKDGWSLGTDMVIQELRREDCRWLPRSTIDGFVHKETQEAGGQESS